MIFLAGDIDFVNTALTHLTPTAILVIVVVYLVLKERASVRNSKNGNPGQRPIICPMDPTELHADLREIVAKLDRVAELLNRVVGRGDDGGRRHE